MEDFTFDYITEYNQFLKDFNLMETTGSAVGLVIAKMAGYYAIYNIRMGHSLEKFSAVKCVYQNNPDPSTGKPISSAKAEILADNTEEAAAYEMNRIHINSLEQIMNSLKSLQKGILTEYSGTN